MSYFQSKGERSAKPLNAAAPESRLEAAAAPAKPVPEVMSTLGPGMLITGNILCTGAVQILGRVIGDIHVARLVVCEGAHVEGKIVAQDAVIDGAFRGTIHANNVKLQSTAVVEGEIYNRSLTIEQDAQFEGVARRLDKAVDMPATTQAKSEAKIAAQAPALAPAPTTTADVVPLSSVLHPSHAANGTGQSWAT